MGQVGDDEGLLPGGVDFHVVGDVSLGQEDLVDELVALRHADHRLPGFLGAETQHEGSRPIQDAAVSKDDLSPSQHTVDFIDVVGDFGVGDEGAVDSLHGQLTEHLLPT